MAQITSHTSEAAEVSVTLAYCLCLTSHKSGGVVAVGCNNNPNQSHSALNKCNKALNVVCTYTPLRLQPGWLQLSILEPILKTEDPAGQATYPRNWSTTANPLGWEDIIQEPSHICMCVWSSKTQACTHTHQSLHT